jgi:type IV secretion system protein VirB11
MDNRSQSRSEQSKQDTLDALWERLEPLKPYLEESGVEEVAINRVGEVRLWKSGRWESRLVPEITLRFLETIGANLASYTGKPFNRQHTNMSTHLPTGERVEMTHPPQSPEDVLYVNIRKHSGEAFPHEKLVQQGYYNNVRHEQSLSLTTEQRKILLPHLTDREKELWALATSGKWATFMQKAVEGYQNIVVSGATGSGKTSYCRSLIELISPEDRIVTVEDTPEMPLPNHPNNNRLLFKKNPDDAEGATAKDVMHSVMRKTPKRVLLAELRGDEAMFYLSGVLSSGHPGGITTTHANSPRDAFFRLALLILSSDAGKTLDMETTKMLLHMTVHVVVQLEFDDKKNRRYVSGIYYDPMHRLSLLG